LAPLTDAGLTHYRGDEELRAIDQFAKEGGIDLWRETSEL
jgi:hypothetical protein